MGATYKTIYVCMYACMHVCMYSCNLVHNVMWRFRPKHVEENNVVNCCVWMNLP